MWKVKILDESNNDACRGKVNFVDRNNVFVGYDLSQSCCEDADWVITKERIFSVPDKRGCDFSVEDYDFDPKFFERFANERPWEGGLYCAVFRLVHNSESLQAFLTLFNESKTDTTRTASSIRMAMK